MNGPGSGGKGKKAFWRIAALMVAVLLCAAAGSGRVYAQAGDENTSGAADTAVQDASAAEASSGEEDGSTPGTSADEGISGAVLSQGTGQTVISMVGKYDSADLACVVYVNEAEQKITLHNHDTGRNYTLEYDSTSHFVDAYGAETNPQALTEGDLAYVTFLKSSKHLNSLKMSYEGDVWRHEDQRNYTLPVTLSTAGPTVSSMATIAGKRYLMDVRTLVLVEGRQARPSAIVEGDLITAWGVGNEVYCVKVTRGHGYLRLSHDTVDGVSLEGAWIELDNTVIRKITPRMLVTAPEGTYTLYIIGNGANYSTEVTIVRGKETVVDTSGIPMEKPKQGKVRFSLMPEDAKVRVDDYLLKEGEDSIELEYGLHTLELKAEGYETMFRYLRVGSPSAVVRLEMERAADAQSTASGTSASSGSSGSGNNASSQNTSSSSGSSGTDNSGNNNTDNSGNQQTDNSGNNNTNNAGNGSTEQSGNQSSGDNNSGNNEGGNGNSGSSEGGNGNSGSSEGGNNNSGSNNGNSEGGSGNTQTEEAGQNGIITTGRIYVDAPSGAAFYLDGNFIGFIPVSFEKASGIHTVTLSQQGRRTISYNIELDSSKSDKTFNFPAMEPE